VIALSDNLEATILIVEDERAVCDLLTLILSAQHTCITASAVEEAIQFLSSGRFDVVITDVAMPDDTGRVLFDFIQRSHPETVILVISGDSNKDRIALHGAFDFIEQPFDPEQVQMAVGRALSYKRLRRNLTCPSLEG